MVAGVGARAVGPFQVWVPKVPEVTPWRFSQTGQLQGHQTEPGLPRKLKMLFCPFTDCDVWGPKTPHISDYTVVPQYSQGIGSRTT